MANSLKKWFLDNNKYTRDREKVTHYLLDGGKLNLSLDFETFLDNYIKHFDEKTCIVELKTNIFKFFIDFDILSIEIFDIDKYVKIIQDSIKDIYGDYHLCIITAPDKILEKNKNSIVYYKQGFHFHWPTLDVDKDTALKIRQFLINKLTTLNGNLKDNTWDSIIDDSVYKSNGLRIIGADKCKLIEDKYFYENRVYMLYSVYINSEKDEAKINEYNNLYKLLKDTSIRSSSSSISEYINLLDYETIEEKTDIDPTKIIINDTDPKNIQIKKFFKNHVFLYSVSDIKTISQIKTDSYLIQTKSKYCQNIKKSHTNNHVYFLLTTKGLVQRCHSNSCNEESFCCRDYQSPCIKCDFSLRNVLGGKYLNNTNFKTTIKTNNFSNILEDRIIGK